MTLTQKCKMSKRKYPLSVLKNQGQMRVSTFTLQYRFLQEDICYFVCLQIFESAYHSLMAYDGLSSGFIT